MEQYIWLKLATTCRACQLTQTYQLHRTVRRQAIKCGRVETVNLILKPSPLQFIIISSSKKFDDT